MVIKFQFLRPTPYPKIEKPEILLPWSKGENSPTTSARGKIFSTHEWDLHTRFHNGQANYINMHMKVLVFAESGHIQFF